MGRNSINWTLDGQHWLLIIEEKDSEEATAIHFPKKGTTEHNKNKKRFSRTCDSKTPFCT